MQAELPGTDLARPVHPVAEMFPMMSDEELDDLAADIQANGLVHPIVIDRDGVLIDGRNRREACRRAGVEPEWTTFDGDDPVAFILSSNVNRRHLSKGQAAMAVAKANRIGKKLSAREAAEQIGASKQRVVQANVVLQYAEEYGDRVLAGTVSLDDAYAVARERKEAALAAVDETERLRAEMRRLQAQASDLADLVAEERMSLPEALAALEERERQQREEERKEREYRALTTRQLDGVLSFLDPRKIGAAELAMQLAANTDPSTLSMPPDVSPERVRTCAAVLEALADALSSKES